MTTGFLENVGQFDDDDVLFYANLGSVGIAFVEGGVLMNVEEPQDPTEHRRLAMDGHQSAPLEEGDMAPSPRTRRGCTVRLDFLEARAVEPMGSDRLPWDSNFFLGQDSSRWRTGIATYGQVTYEGLYEGVDLVYRVGPSGVKYEFIVAPGADPGIIRVGVEGQDGLAVRDGALVISTAGGEIVDSGLCAFYLDAPDEGVECSFELMASDTYSFRLVAHDSNRALVIDPLVFSTYLGASKYDRAYRLEMDDEGDLILGGNTTSSKFPTTPGAYDTTYASEEEIFVMKFASNGSAILWSTFLGGNATDNVEAIHLNETGDIYLGGYSYSSDFPVTPGAIQPKLSGGHAYHHDAIFCKLSKDGRKLIYSTYLGGNEWQRVDGIVTDNEGNTYLTGYTAIYQGTTGSYFPVTEDAYQTSMNGERDVFVCKLDPDATSFIYSTLLGGEGSELVMDIDLDDDGRAYVCGITVDGFPTTTGAVQTRYSGGADAFVTILSADGSELVHSTYLGGTGRDSAEKLLLDESDNVHVIGVTKSNDFPVTWGTYQTKPGAENDCFAAMLSSDLSSILFATYLGGQSSDCTIDADLDPVGNVVIVGWTRSSDFPTTPRAAQTKNAGDWDAFVSKLSANYTDLLYSTYIGGSMEEHAFGCKVYGEMFVYVCGYTSSSNFPTTKGAFQTRLGGSYDGFVAKVAMDLDDPTAVAGDDIVIDQHETVLFNGTLSTDNIAVANWTWSFEYDGKDMAIYGAITNFTFHTAGRYAVTLTVTDIAGHRAQDVLNVTVRDITPPMADAGRNRTIRQHETIDFDGTASSDNVAVVNWTWDLTYAGETFYLYGPIPSFTFDIAGEFPATLTVRDGVGLNATDRVWVRVHDVTAPVADAGDDVTVDQHETVQFDGGRSSDNSGVVNWTWDLVHAGENVTLYGVAPEFTFELAGEYIVTLRVSDQEGNTDMDSVTVVVRDTTDPMANAGPDQVVEQGQTVKFDGRGSSDNVRILTWEWTFMYDTGPVILTGPKPEFHFDLAGVFVVTLTVTDAMGNRGTDEVVITVRDLTAPVADAGPDITVDQRETVILDGSASTDNVGITSCTWRFNTGGQDRELPGLVATFAFEDAGTYIVTLTVTDASGNSDSDTLEVTVLDTTPPVADPGEDVTVDQHATVTLDGSGSRDNVGVESWRWSFEHDGGPVTLEGSVVFFDFDLAGEYVVELTVTDARGNSASGIVTVKVRDTTDPVIPDALSDKEIELGEFLHFSAAGAHDNVGIVSYTWTIRGGRTTTVLEGMEVDRTFDAAGVYDVTLTVEDAAGNSASADFKVTVRHSPLFGSALPIALVVIIIVVAAVALYVNLRKRRAGPGA